LRPVFDPAVGQMVQAGVVARDDISPGQIIQGPAAITERETTIIVPTSREAIRQPDGCIELMARSGAST
ncbi:MAG: hypothetical protein AAFY03_08765, partial [Pseudomonadota bacterium]